MERDPRVEPQSGDRLRLAGTEVFVCSAGAGCVLIHSERWPEEYNELIGLDEWQKYMKGAAVMGVARA